MLISRLYASQAIPVTDEANQPETQNPTDAATRSLHISFEFFPPKTEQGVRRFSDVVQRLAAWKPRFVSITCGADGTATEGTLATVRAVREAYGLPVVPHMAMSRTDRPHLREILKTYKELGVTQVVALRGDAPKIPTKEEGHDFYPTTVEFVTDLAALGFEPIVAAYPDVHPLAQSPQQDLDHLKKKIDAGAKHAITQFFFEAETYLRFRDKVAAAGIDIPLIPGIMPVHNVEQIVKFAKMCGAIVPEDFAAKFTDAAQDPQRFFDQSVATGLELCDRLRQEGVEGFHFYALNRDETVHAICEGLGLEARGQQPGKSS